MKVRVTIFAALMSLGGLQAVHALTLYSRTLRATTYRTVSCSLLNVSSQPRTAKFLIVSWNGTVLAESGNKVIPPGTVRHLSVLASAGAYCKVQVTGVKTDWRGAFELLFWINNSIPVTDVSVPLE
jgi:hypothetical protein